MTKEQREKLYAYRIEQRSQEQAGVASHTRKNRCAFVEEKVREVEALFAEGCRAHAILEANQDKRYVKEVMQNVAQSTDHEITGWHIREWRRVAQVWTEHRDPTDFLAWVWGVYDRKGRVTKENIKATVFEEAEQWQANGQGNEEEKELERDGERKASSGPGAFRGPFETPHA